MNMLDSDAQNDVARQDTFACQPLPGAALHVRRICDSETKECDLHDLHEDRGIGFFESSVLDELQKGVAAAPQMPTSKKKKHKSKGKSGSHARRGGA